MSKKEIKCGIYSIQNIKNGKRYIGQSTNIYKRWAEHKRELKKNIHHSIYLQRSWNKYKSINFKFEIIEECTKFELYEKEMFYINKFNSIKHGYNMVGSSRHGIDYNPTTIKRMRECQKSRAIIQIDIDGNIIKEWKHGARHAAKELKVRQSGIIACCSKRSSTAYGSIWIYKDKFYTDLIENRIKNMLNKKVVQLTLDFKILKTWNTIKEAASKTGIDTSAISKVCRHKNSNAKGYRWEYYDNFVNGNINKMIIITKRVSQFSLDGILLNTFKSANSASLSVFGVRDNGNIGRCCKGQIETHRGFKWRFSPINPL